MGTNRGKAFKESSLKGSCGNWVSELMESRGSTAPASLRSIDINSFHPSSLSYVGNLIGNNKSCRLLNSYQSVSTLYALFNHCNHLILQIMKLRLRVHLVAREPMAEMDLRPSLSSPDRHYPLAPPALSGFRVTGWDKHPADDSSLSPTPQTSNPRKRNF